MLLFWLTIFQYLVNACYCHNFITRFTFYRLRFLTIQINPLTNWKSKLTYPATILILNCLSCLPLLEQGATPLAEVQALSSGHNSLSLLTHPCFSLVKTSCVTFTHMYSNITLVHSQSTAYNTPMGD